MDFFVQFLRVERNLVSADIELLSEFWLVGMGIYPYLRFT